MNINIWIKILDLIRVVDLKDTSKVESVTKMGAMYITLDEICQNKYKHKKDMDLIRLMKDSKDIGNGECTKKVRFIGLEQQHLPE